MALVLVLTRSEVDSLLDLDALREAVASALKDLSAGRASMPPRIAAMIPERDGILAAMPAYLPAAGALTTKLVSLFPHNNDRPTHQAVIVAFDPENGTPAALMDGEAITAARTAAGSALSTVLLARGDASVLAVLGTGVQARSHLRAVPRVLANLKEVRIAGRDEGKAGRLADELGRELRVPVRAMASYEEASAGAHVICGATHSPEPVLRRRWIGAGTHVTSVGFNPAGREVDGELVRDALVVVESRDAALAPPPRGSNDLTWAIRDGLVGADPVHAEIGELIAGAKSGRTSPEQITLYKSVGVAVQDAAAAALVLAAARQRRIGREVEV